MPEARRFIELVSVSKSFAGTPAVIDFSLAVQRGEFITLLGPSGCGKTTTLRLIAGFLRPDAGELLIDGSVLSSANVYVAPEKRNMGMVFQSYAVWPHMSVFDNVALPLRVRGASRADIEGACDEILRLCRLEELRRRDPHQLSGGQLQRVALARALVYRPTVLLLDEPLSNLDLSLREEMRRELQIIHNATHTTFILVTHDQVEAMSLSDRVVVINQGRIEQIGTPREIYRSPRTEFVAQFVGGANLQKGVIIATQPMGPYTVYRLRIYTSELSVHHYGKAVAGPTCTVVIYPEAIRLSSPGAARLTDNTFSGTVREVYFLGRTQEAVVDVNGFQLRAIESQGTSRSAGEAVQVHISPNSIVLF
jgi:ABC-type Fe3+/spermidine/putrescine transport system ATPase subunit